MGLGDEWLLCYGWGLKPIYIKSLAAQHLGKDGSRVKLVF